MYSLVNNVKGKVIANLKNDSELIDKVAKIVRKNKHFDYSVLGVSDAIEYIEDYCEDLSLLDDDEVKEFLNNYGIKVRKNEPDHYVELMMDDHKCIKWNGKQYYINENLTLTEEEEKIYDVLAYYLHV